jgi:Domain of unknown function (DUF4258)
VRITRHAEERMAEREISLAEVQEVYDGAEMTYASKHGDPCLAKQIGGRVIKIVVIQGTDRIKTVIDQ